MISAFYVLCISRVAWPSTLLAPAVSRVWSQQAVLQEYVTHDWYDLMNVVTEDSLPAARNPTPFARTNDCQTASFCLSWCLFSFFFFLICLSVFYFLRLELFLAVCSFVFLFIWLAVCQFRVSRCMLVCVPVCFQLLPFPTRTLCTSFRCWDGSDKPENRQDKPDT